MEMPWQGKEKKGKGEKVKARSRARSVRLYTHIATN